MLHHCAHLLAEIIPHDRLKAGDIVNAEEAGLRRHPGQLAILGKDIGDAQITTGPLTSGAVQHQVLDIHSPPKGITLPVELSG